MNDIYELKTYISKNLDFIFSYLLSFFYILPLILGNNLYEDDLLRNNTASSISWFIDERPFYRYKIM